MKQLLIISGKGGTGKTSIAAAFAVLAGDSVIADCDVDAANLHLLLGADQGKAKDFIGSKKATIDSETCIACGICFDYCRFDAIQNAGTHYIVDDMSCEGCGVCHLVCPVDAVTLHDHVSGQWISSKSPYGPFIHAQLGIAEENSGKLVAKVKEEATHARGGTGHKSMLIDGPPGTGCPVISSISGIDLALIVTEPTVAGLHDLKRVVDLTDHFRVPAVVCINKYDLDVEYSKTIESYCRENNLGFAGRIPFDRQVVDSLTKGMPVVGVNTDTSANDGGASKAIRHVWAEVLNHLKKVAN